MSPIYFYETENAIPIIPLDTEALAVWLQANSFALTWVKQHAFTAKPGQICIIPSTDLAIKAVLLGVKKGESIWALGDLASKLPVAGYQLLDEFNLLEAIGAYLGWGLGCYQFCKYKPAVSKPSLFLPQAYRAEVTSQLVAINLVRDLINTAPEDMQPGHLAKAVISIATQFKADCKVLVGEELLAENYPAIYAVGRAGAQPPRLITLTWGESHHPKLTLVGKGVCFDTGGLDIKTAGNMLLMKKDMGGAACVLGLAYLIMQAKLPVRLKVLIPAVENAISAQAYRPSDVLTMRNGLTVEVGNTDAEGRLILADALTEAVADHPELVIDFATLTGAARIALGTDLPAFYTNTPACQTALMASAQAVDDPIWPMPLYQLYGKDLESNVADLSNVGPDSYGGSIIAALFLEKFVQQVPWVHIDLMAWNRKTLSGRPKGGEAQGVRAVFAYLKQRFG